MPTATSNVDSSIEAMDTEATPSQTGSNKSAQLSLTPRFSQEEKDILYELFNQHCEVIDIKLRKKQRNKHAVREAWNEIVRSFNANPNISAVRTPKQIQKFWLNARLRKQYPYNSTSGGVKRLSNTTKVEIVVPHDIKDEPEFGVSQNEGAEGTEANESFEEMEMEVNGEGQQIEEDPIEVQQRQQQQQQQQQQQHHQQQQQQLQQAASNAGTIQTQQISVDQISAEKLTLNDLLQFKTARPREEIILQIKHPSDTTEYITGTQITLPSPTRISIPAHHQPQQHTMATITASGYNQQIISEIKPQQITLAQYNQAQQQQQQQLAQQQQQHQQQMTQQHQLVVATAPQQQQQQVKMQLQTQPATAQQYATAAPTFTCTTFNAVPTAGQPTLTSGPTPVQIQAANVASANAAAQENFEEKINYFKLKEAELRFKEEQVALEKKKIELNRAQEELKHLKELHRLQVEEMRFKIRILQEEEKQLRRTQSMMPT